MAKKVNLSKDTRRIAGFASAAALALAMTVGLGGSAAISTEITPNSVDPVQHFFDCLGALFNDPEAHAAYCSPGQPGPDGSTHTLMGTCPAPDVADDAVDHTSCYVDVVFDTVSEL